MGQFARDRSLWMGAVGGLVGVGLLQVFSSLFWARGQFALAENGLNSPAESADKTTDSSRNRPETVPRLIPFQGYLTDAAGRPVEGPHTLMFRLYDDPIQGSALWTETHADVPVTNGLVNVILGGTTPFGSLTFDAERYVGVRVDGGLELVPRQQVIPAIHAADSSRLGGSPGGYWANSAEITPIGGVIAYFGDALSLPANWRVCDGSVVNDPTSPLNGVTLPNMSGRFARGPAGIEQVGQTGGQDGHAHTVSPGGSHHHLMPILTVQEGSVDRLWLIPGTPAPFAPAGSADIVAFDISNVAPTTRTYDAGRPAYYSLTADTNDHTHSVNTADNVPGYVALYYIIRIK